MPITFDTMEELIAFYETFSLEGKPKKQKSAAAVAAPKAPAVKTARKSKAEPKTKLAKAKVSKIKVKRGRPPAAKKATVVKATTTRVKKTMTPKVQAKLQTPLKTSTRGSLTTKIKSSIQSFLDKNQEFTANSVYDVLAKKDKGVNKQSVITSVLKQMNTTFSKVKVTERPGAGPRPVKLYNPQ